MVSSWFGQNRASQAAKVQRPHDLMLDALVHPRLEFEGTYAALNGPISTKRYRSWVEDEFEVAC